MVSCFFLRWCVSPVTLFLFLHHSDFTPGGADTVSGINPFKVGQLTAPLLECFCHTCILLSHDTLSGSPEESSSGN